MGILLPQADLQRRLLLNRRSGIIMPSWILSVAGVPATLDIDFVNNRAWNSGAAVSISSLLSCTRASGSGYYTNADGSLTTFGANTLRTGNNGLLTEETRTNIFLNSDTPATQNVSVSATAYTLSLYGTGTITLSGASTAGPLVGSGGSTTRVTLTFTPSAGTLTLTVSGSPEKVQLEAGAYATSYIPTTSSTAQRNEDAIVFNSVSWFNEATGSFYLSNSENAVGTTAVTYRIWSISTGSSSFEHQLSHFNGIPLYAINNTTTQANLSSGTLAANATRKWAAAYATNDAAVSLNGSAIQTDATVSLPTGMTTSGIGNVNGATIRGSRYVKRLAYWNGTRISNANLVALAT